MKHSILVLIVAILFFSPTTFAGKDPIGWSITAGGLPATSNVGSSYAVTYTMRNNLPFAVPLTVFGTHTGGKFSFVNECNRTLAPNETCLVHVLFQPIFVRNNTMYLTLAYHNNRVPLPTLSSNSVSQETQDRINGHVTEPLPPVTYTGIGFPVEFTFVNNGDANVTATAVNVVGFAPTTNTCTVILNAHQTCVVSGTFTPTTPGLASLSVTYVYSGGSVPLSTASNVHPNGPNCHLVSGYAELPLPNSTFIYANNVIKYKFTNYCTATAEQLGTVNITTDSTAASPPTLIKGAVNTDNDTCSGKVLTPSSSCNVYVSVIPNSTYASGNDLTVKATVNYNNNSATAEAISSEIVNALSNQSTLHTLMIVNQCSQPVWNGFSNASLDPTANKTWQGYQLDTQLKGAAPATRTFQFSSYTGGTIFGRTLCDTATNPKTATYGVCQTGSCTNINNSTGTCNYSPLSPTTLLEENMLNTTAQDGVYDISLINGFNLPTEFRSLAPITPISRSSDFNFTTACGISAGAMLQPTGPTAPNLGFCSWSFTPPSTGTDCTSGTLTDNPSNYYAVPAGTGDGCTPGSCGGSNVCGMSWTPTSAPNPQYQGTPISRHCGQFLGYWTLTDWTNYTTAGQWDGCNLYNHYSMATTLDSVKPASQPTYGYSQLNPTLSPNLPAAMLADIFACKPTSKTPVYVQPNGSIYVLNSGYDACPIDLPVCNPCGCHDWNNTVNTPAAAQTGQQFQCKAFNPLFDTYVYNRILWLKEACPTAYSYQFDDASSQFTCNVTGQRTSYQITFCPGGKTGAPA